jgi:hypothetical protein
MSAADLTTSAASQQAVVEAALVLLERMGLSPADLAAAPRDRKTVPTFAEYVPVVSATVSPGTRRAYGSYWNRVVEHWGGRRHLPAGHHHHRPAGQQRVRAVRGGLPRRRHVHAPPRRAAGHPGPGPRHRRKGELRRALEASLTGQLKGAAALAALEKEGRLFASPARDRPRHAA